MKTISDLKKELDIIDERIAQIITAAQRKIDKLEIKVKRIENQILNIEKANEIYNHKLKSIGNN